MRGWAAVVGALRTRVSTDQSLTSVLTDSSGSPGETFTLSSPRRPLPRSKLLLFFFSKPFGCVTTSALASGIGTGTDVAGAAAFFPQVHMPLFSSGRAADVTVPLRLRALVLAGGVGPGRLCLLLE